MATLPKKNSLFQTGLQALGWQGGTLWQVIAACKTRANITSSTYRYGSQSAIQFPCSIDELQIPINSWDSDSQCSIDYIAGFCNELDKNK